MAECTHGSGRFFELILECVLVLGDKKWDLNVDRNMLIFLDLFLTVGFK